MVERKAKPVASASEAPPRRKRGLIWLIFFAPGALMMWWEYMFPKAGDGFGSGRRRDNRLLQFGYTMGIYAVLFVMWLLFTGRLDNPRPSPEAPVGPASATQSGVKP